MISGIDISVIIPAYNAENTISKLIDSLILESEVSIEIIIINDGSTDNTQDIISQYTDTRLIMIHQHNQGLSAARNAGLAIHRGRWVVFLDADDDIEPAALAARYHLAEHHDVDLLICNAKRLDASGNFRGYIHREQIYNKVINGFQWIEYCVKQREWPHYVWLQLIKSSYIIKHNIAYRALRSHEDICWTMDLSLADGRFFISNVADYSYRDNELSITHHRDYYDIRAENYIHIISYIQRQSRHEKYLSVSRHLKRHALWEARHFFGLLKRKVTDRNKLRKAFTEQVSFPALLYGVANLSDMVFLLKLFLNVKRG
ncbi:glycosyltransferase [Winslowiella iniecta]|uniref:Glycosyltransferase 2-like domain-containing protein n=1 Tax=Winslowiella iniecta TaxID=1560201 RepID=A0A0L7T488_9GAMM|nr:glycosyltransferase [Winslowiella iniecta]KOC87806.1 hypothetical protein NG42_19105 [Winslowiella iniecta]KOC90021.1 hypothetical protein NG43_17650 [Winslowiella iniecta]